MTLLRYKHCTFLELSKGKSLFPSVVRVALAEALNAIDQKEVAIALNQPEHVEGNFDNLVLARLRTQLPTGFSIERKAQVLPDSRFENDFTISGPNSAISVEIEKGDRARLDLDIRKMEAFARHSPKSTFGVFIVPLNNRLDRSISGNTRESSFDYLCRTLRLATRNSVKKSLPAVSTRDRVGEALNFIKNGLEPYIDHEMKKIHGKDWAQVTRSNERKQPQSASSWDAYGLLKVIISNWNDVFGRVLSQTTRSLTHELLDVRNRWAHQAVFSPDDTHPSLPI